MAHHNESSGMSFLAGALLGGLVGAGLGLLFAPAKGEETRKKLQKAGSDTLKKAEVKFNEFKREQVDPLLAKGEKELRKVEKDLKDKFDKAREGFAAAIEPKAE